MLANETFFMRLSGQEKTMLRHVAKHLQRSQADTIRMLVRETYKVIKAEKTDEGNATGEHTSRPIEA
jgi:hypothetical protein